MGLEGTSGSSSDGVEYWRGIAADSLWTALGQGFRYLSGAVASIAVARLLGAELFGEYGMITSTVGLLATAADLGMGVTATRCVAAYRVFEPERARRSLGMSIQATFAMALALGTVLVISAPYVAAGWLGHGGLAGPLRGAALAIMFTAAGSAVSGGLRGLGLFRSMARAEMSLALLTALLTVGGAWVGRLEGSVLGFVIGSGLRVAALGALLIRYTRPLGWTLWSRDVWHEASTILRFSMPAFASGFMVTPVLWAVRVLLANSPGGYAEVGAFSAALQLQTPLTFLSTVLASVLLPSMSEQFEQGNRTRLLGTFRVSFVTVAAVQLMASIVVVLLSGVLASLYGKSYSGLATSLILVASGTFYNAVLSVPGQVLAAMNRMWLGFALNLVWASVLLGVSALAVTKLGAVGASGAYLLAYLIHAVTTTWVVVALGLPTSTMLPVLAASTVALAALSWWRVSDSGVAFFVLGVSAAAYTLLSAWKTMGTRPGRRILAVMAPKKGL